MSDAPQLDTDGEWCEIAGDPHAFRISCNCGLRQFEDARAALEEKAASLSPSISHATEETNHENS